MRNYLMINNLSMSNPVLTSEFAEKICKAVDVRNFDIHISLQDALAGTPSAFVSDAFSRLTWRLDTHMCQTLKQIARGMPKHEGGKTIDSFSEVQNALHELWETENHSYEVGYEDNGPLHTVVMLREIRESWLSTAQIARTAMMATPKPTKSIEVQIATPRKGEVTSIQISNFEFAALKLVKGLSDVKLRGEFREGISMNDQLMSIERDIREKNPVASDEQVFMWCEQNAEFKEIMAKRAKLSSTAAKAINHRQQLIDDQEALYLKWYQAEIEMTDLQLHVYEYCGLKMAGIGKSKPEFHQLSPGLQAMFCVDTCESLDKTLSKYSSKLVYSTYSNIIDAVKELLHRVASTQLDDVGYATSDSRVEEILARSNARRARNAIAD